MSAGVAEEDSRRVRPEMSSNNGMDWEATGALGLFSEADGEPWEDCEERRTMS